MNTSDRRAFVRLPIGRATRLVWGDRDEPVEVEDVSMSGAKLRLDNPPSVGLSVALCHGDDRVTAEVVRAFGGSVALRFSADEESATYLLRLVAAIKLAPGEDEGVA